MAPQTVTVKYSKPGTQPPIYLAGSFSEPAWQPQEMQYSTDASGEHEFYKEVEVEQGKEYQYKFRLGHVGDWWILNEDSPTVTDDIGNKNNLLSIPKVEEPTTATDEPKSTSQEAEAEKAESPSTASMEKEKTPSIEETMGTRETDDTLFADEIIKDTDEPKEDPKSSIVEGAIEPPPTPASLEKPKTEHIEEAEHTKELQDINGAEPSTSQLGESDIIEPTPAPYMDIKKIRDLEDTDSKNASDDQTEEDKAIAPPALVVEQAEPEPEEEEKSSVDLTAVGHDTEHLQTADTSQETRNGARTPELADTAAEVADVASTLDRDQPTPPISDEEAGRIGLRRMSLTPIPQVSSTAAEVADVAAIIDKEEDQPEEFIRPFDVDDGPLPETPPNEKVPLFSHECCSPPDHKEPSPQEEDFDPYEGMRPRVEVDEHIDLNDPNIKMFPTDRAGIMEHLRQMQERLPEDEVKLDLAPRSPVIDPNNPRAERRESRDLPAVSPVVLAERSPSLDSIPEDNESSNVLAAAPVQLNGEDKPATNGINITKHELATSTADESPVAKENEAPLLGKVRDLAGSVDGSDESGLNAKSPETENTETEASVTEQSAEESLEEARRKDISEAQDTEPTKSTEEGTNGVATAIPEVSIQKFPAERASKDTLGKVSLDSICAGGSHVVPSAMTPFIVGNRQLGHDVEEVEELRTGQFSPTITVQPATPLPDINRRLGYDDAESPNLTVSSSTLGGSSTVTDTIIKQNDMAKSTAVENETDDVHVKSRKRQPSPARSPERPVTPTSMRSPSKDVQDVKERNVFKAFFRIVFVEWIGGFFLRLCGGRRRRQ